MARRANKHVPLFEASRPRLRKQAWFLKGQIAESIIERLFDAHGYEILPYGVEKRFPGWLHDNEVSKHSAAYRQLRAAPDFVVKVPEIDSTQKRLIPIEVKYRTVGWIEPRELVRYVDFHSTMLVLVDPKGIRGNFVENLLGGASLIPLVEIGALSLQSEIVKYFERIVQHLYNEQWQKHFEAR